MNVTVNKEKFFANLTNFNPSSQAKIRMLSLFSASLTFDDAPITTLAINRAVELQVNNEELYEVVLQSYLFLGFPRMLQAAELLHRIAPVNHTPLEKSVFLSTTDFDKLYKRGEEACQKVYGSKFEILKERVLGYAPDIYHWMILEGYGKVLSRGVLSLEHRELSVVAFLTMENRKRQLHSHIIGAVHAGATLKLISQIVDDIGESAGEGYFSAISIIEHLEENS